MAGVWKTDGPAVCFQSDNFLQKAGGAAVASAVESKLSPYYKKYGLNSATITIQTDGTFTMTVKKMTLSGTITQESGASAGVFTFNFSALGGLFTMGSVTTYVEKTSSSMSIMFDASKFKSILSSMAKLTGNSLASTAASLLDSYEGMCVGFHMNKTGNVSTTTTSTTTTTTTSDSDSSVLGGLGSLLLGGSNTGTTTNSGTTTNKTTTTTTNTNTNTNTNTDSTTTSSGLDLLKGLFGK
jgi:hypothetical protein